MLIALYILLALIILILAAGAFVFWVACSRRKEPNWLCEEEIKKIPQGKYYDFMVQADRFLKEHNARDIYTQSNDGLKLHGLWIPAQQPKGTILLVHGYRSTKLIDFALAFEMYHHIGMNILVPDQRCLGMSEGKYITFGVKESGDVERWVRYHNQTFGNMPIILSGLSMGASTVLYTADKKLPDNVKGIIADCGFTAPCEIIKHVFRTVTHIPPGPVLWVADLFARIFAGFSFWERDTRKILRHNRLPVLMVHGTDDRYVPSEMTKQGYEACVGDKQLLLVKGAGHGTSFLVDRPRYEEQINCLLMKTLEETE